MNQIEVEQRIAEGLRALARGSMVIVADDDDREAEGDFIIAAEFVKPEDINLMASRGRGLVCVAIEQSIADHLALRVQPGALHATAFTQSLDFLHGTTTGISCADRALGLRAMVDPTTQNSDYATPGHLFPLVAQSGGVLKRRGHTEAAVDLCRLAGLKGAGVICEIMNPDGSMARSPQLQELASELGIPFLTVDDLAHWRQEHEFHLILGTGGRIPTEFGEFSLYQPRNVLASEAESRKQIDLPLLLCYGFDPKAGPQDDLTIRIHSECVTGDLFGSLRCDCGPQLQEAMRRIAAIGKGAIIYLRQEGRGIGLPAKLEAYGLQDGGLDTIDANLALGLPADAREYADAIAILRLIECTKVRLLSNNPDKIQALKSAGISVIETEPLIIRPNVHNMGYLETKRRRLGHTIQIPLEITTK